MGLLSVSAVSRESFNKSYLFLKGKRGILTHSVDRLINECKKLDNNFIQLKRAKELDQYYIPTRYPNGLPDEIPHKFYDEEDALKCVNYAEEIIKLVQKLVKR